MRTFLKALLLLAAFVSAPARAQNPLADAAISVPTCPVANCPAGPRGPTLPGGGPVLSAQWLHGRTAKDAMQDEWLSNLGLFIGTGRGGGQKVTQYLGAMQGPGAGAGWALNTDIVRGACPGGPDSLYGQPGSGIPFGAPGCTARPGSLGTANTTVGYELDLTNWDQDGGPGGPLVVGMMVQTLSSFPGTAGILFNSYARQAVPGWHSGIQFTGPIDHAPATARDNTVLDGSGSEYGYHLHGVHAGAGLRDDGTGRVGVLLLGTKTEADLQADTASPAGIAVAGRHANQAIGDTSVTPAALNLAGQYGIAAVVTSNASTPIALSAKAGQSVCFDGAHACARYDAAARKWYFTNGAGEVVSSVDDAGNAVFRGTVTQKGVP